jgi:outer membrane protein TolC
VNRPFALLVAVTVMGATPSPAQGPRSLEGAITLEQAVRFALERSPQLASARYTADMAHAEHSVRWLSRVPKPILTGSIEDFPVNQKLQLPRHMDIPGPTNPDPFAFFRRQFQTTVYNLGATVSLPVYSGGRLQAQIAAAGHLAEAAEASATATRDALIFTVAAAYYNVLRLQKVVAATAAVVRRLEESERIVAQQVSVGAAARIDLYRVRTRLANTRQELTRRTGDLEKAKTALRAAMGVEDVLQPITLADTLAYVPEHDELAEDVQTALRRRPEYLAQSEMVEARGRMVRAAIAGYLPDISLNAFYNQAYGSTSATWRSDAGIFVKVALAFLDPVNPAAVREARAARLAEEQRLEQLRLEVIRQVQTAYLNRSEAEQRIATAQASLQEAREALRIEQLRLETGRQLRQRARRLQRRPTGSPESDRRDRGAVVTDPSS